MKRERNAADKGKVAKSQIKTVCRMVPFLFVPSFPSSLFLLLLLSPPSFISSCQRKGKKKREGKSISKTEQARRIARDRKELQSNGEKKKNGETKYRSNEN